MKKTKEYLKPEIEVLPLLMELPLLAEGESGTPGGGNTDDKDPNPFG